MDDAVRRYAKAARRMGCDAGIARVPTTDERHQGQVGRWVLVRDKKFWVPEAYALMESPAPVSGTTTGRWTGGSMNMQELPRKEKK